MNIIESGFKSPIYPVNPKANKLCGLKCYLSVLDVKEPIGLAVIAVPAIVVPEVVKQVGEKGIKGLVAAENTACVCRTKLFRRNKTPLFP
jgi:acyl-CoA synthetase (NDP forming)